MLDVGCGRAVLLAALAGLGAECHGLEREGFDSGDVSGAVSMHLGAVESLPFQPGSFQLVILWHVLEHLERPGKTLHQLAELLSPGGLMAIAVPNIDSLQARWFGPLLQQAWHCCSERRPAVFISRHPGMIRWQPNAWGSVWLRSD